MSRSGLHGLAQIRRAAADRAAETSVRSTAAEIGLSYTGMRGFLGGGKPHPETLRLLVDWYSAKSDPGDQSWEEIQIAAARLAQYISHAATSRSIRSRSREVLQALSEALDDKPRAAFIAEARSIPQGESDG